MSPQFQDRLNRFAFDARRLGGLFRLLGFRDPLSDCMEKPSRECVVIAIVEVLLNKESAKFQDIRRRCGRCRLF